MSNARNLANLLGTGSTIVTAKIADDAITAAKIATDAVVADGLSSSAITAGDLPSDSVLQMVHTSTTAFSTCTSTSYTDITGMSLTITPSSTSSRIFIYAAINLSVQGAASNIDLHGACRLLRGSSEIYKNDLRTYEFNGDAVYVNVAVPFIFVDGPSTTSAITYKFQGKEVSSGITSLDVNAEATNRSTFILQEIAG